MPDAVERKPFYTLSEAARILGVHRQTVARALNSGAIRGVKLNRTWRIPDTELFLSDEEGESE